MKISKEEVLHVAHLARLNLTENELETMTGQLDNILSYFDKLGELDTAEIQPTTHVFKLSNALREDTVVESLSQQQAVENGPVEDGESFLVPRVI
jgi:aspartyl-tRNA(Asn)/glutamyl-tRNA(Gln) amidotransferase subunit C